LISDRSVTAVCGKNLSGIELATIRLCPIAASPVVPFEIVLATL